MENSALKQELAKLNETLAEVKAKFSEEKKESELNRSDLVKKLSEETK